MFYTLNTPEIKKLFANSMYPTKDSHKYLEIFNMTTVRSTNRAKGRKYMTTEEVYLYLLFKSMGQITNEALINATDGRICIREWLPF